MNRAEVSSPQPAPVSRPGAPSLHDVAAALHSDRRDHGLRVYDTLLTTFNGRGARIDRVQESLDGLVYELQDLIEQQARAAALGEFREFLDLLTGPRVAVESVRVVFDGLMAPAALALRADVIAQRLIEEAKQS